jgi:aspartate/methionine/tyrosine aminotransferase
LLADRIKDIAVSQTMMIYSEAKKLKSQGIDIIDLSVGESDFHTPSNIKESGKNAIDQNKTKYTLNQGTTELRAAIASKLKRDNNLDYTIDEIIVSNGAKQSIYNSILATINPGDEVIVPAPYWVSYPSMIQLAGGKMIVIETEESNGFKISAAQLASAITPKTKMLILCNPSNPTGVLYSKTELENLAEIIKQNNLYVLADEIYEKLVYEHNSFISFASLSDEIKNKTILINGISKSYAMTGWRIGYAAAPENIISAINKIQSHTTSSASSISQYAAIEAVSGPQYVISEMLDEFRKRRDYLYEELISIGRITCQKPDGAFYLFPNISKYFQKHSDEMQINNSFDLSMFLLNEAHVAVVPGIAFGKEEYVRLSYSTSMENLKEAVKRLKKAFTKFS